MSKFFDTVRTMKKVLTKKDEKPKGYDVIATVTGVDGETAWVSIPSGVPETPAQVGVAVKQGDKVMVRVGGGRARIIGNVTSPPTDDTIAQEAHRQSILAYNAVKNVAEQVTVVDEKVVENAEQMAQTVIQINSDIEGLQEQIDGNITSWFYAVDPTLNNPPAIDWLEEGTEAVHLGDLYYNTETGYAWRWMYDSDEDEYGWMRITDVDVVKALADAAKAQDTADSKRRVFVAQPTPPYDVGDLWVQGSGGDILRSTAKRETGASYVAADWIKASKYTDDTVAQQALTSANGKNTIYHSATAPSGGTYKTGDTWFDTDDDNKIYKWSGSTWSPVLLGDDAIDSISANKITAGEIDASQITVSNLDAGNITTGTIDAARINVSQINVGDLHDDGTYLTEVDQLTVDSIEYAYQLSTSGTAVPQGTWQSTPQAPTATQFAWTRTTTNYSDGTSAVTYTVGGKQGIQGIQGQQGIQGIQGETGDDGTTFTPSVDANGNISWTNDGGKTNPTTRNITGPQGDSVSITSTTTRYQSGTSPSSAPTGSWLTSPPTVSAGNYLWTRVIVNYSDGNSTTSYSVARQGENGVDVTSQYMEFTSANGLRVYSGNKSSSTYNTSYTQIKNTGFSITKGGSEVAVFGDSARVGKTGSSDYNVYIDSDGVAYRVGTTAIGTIERGWSNSGISLKSIPNGQISSEVGAGISGTGGRDAYLRSYSSQIHVVTDTAKNSWIDLVANGNSSSSGGYVSINLNSASKDCTIRADKITRSNSDNTIGGTVIDSSMIATGSVSSASISSRSYKDFTISFGKTFSSAPTVTATLVSTSTAYQLGYLSVAVYSTSTTGATLRVFNADSSARSPAINWIAVGI